MGICKSCGVTFENGSRYCPKCGASVADDNTVITEALQKAQENFDKDSMATIDKDRITYVCSVCGSINQIEKDKCTRCGKPRPRSEYVTALKRINQAKEAIKADGALTAPLPVTIEAPVEQQPVQEGLTVVVNNLNEVAPSDSEKAVAQNEVAQPEVQAQPVSQPIVQQVSVLGGQAGPITQPFVVVPYVDSMYPLRQYNPNQLYRYQPYTQEELAAMKAQRAAEELEVRKREGLVAEEEPVNCELDQKIKKVKSLGVGTLILAIVMLAVAAFNAYTLVTGGNITGNVMLLAGAVVGVVMALIGFIHSCTRVSGKSGCRGWIVPILYIVGAVLYFIGGAKEMLDIALVAVACVPAVIYLIISACSPRIKKVKAEK